MLWPVSSVRFTRVLDLQECPKDSLPYIGSYVFSTLLQQQTIWLVQGTYTQFYFEPISMATFFPDRELSVTHLIAASGHCSNIPE